MKIGDLARRCGLSAHTLRYYERIGLLPSAERDNSGQRDYDLDVPIWIEFLGRLKTTGMPIREMLRYTALREEGDKTKPVRQRMLEEHREHVRVHIADLQASLLVLDTKIAGYLGDSKRINEHDAKPETE